MEALRQSALAGQLNGFIERGIDVSGVRLVRGKVAHADMNALRGLGEQLRERLGDGAVGVLGSSDGEKAYLVVSVADDLVRSGIQAGKLVGELARIVGGGGGGRPTLATAGGREAGRLDDALEAARELLSSRAG